jgi:hypothetical protein
VYRSGVQNLSGSVFLAYVLGFGVLFLWSLIFPAYKVLGGFFLHTAFLQGAESFFRYLIPIHATGILLAYSLIPASNAAPVDRTPKNFRSIVGPAAVILITLTLAYTIAVIWIAPMIEQGIRENIRKSEIAKNFFDKAKRAFNDKDYGNASDFVRYSLSIEPTWKEAQALDRTIRRYFISDTDQAQKEKTLGQSGKSQSRYEEVTEGQTPDQIMDKARAFYNAGNYYSAYYYATVVQRIAPARSDAKELAVDSINKVSAYELNATEKETRDYYRRKHDGYTALINRDYITAYYIFNDLAKTHPQDKEVIEYLEKSKQYVNVLTFFSDEVRDIDAFPGVERILFLNKETDAYKEFVWIGKMVQAREGTYFKDIEEIKIANSGEVLSHMKAAYGKYVHAGILKELADNPVASSENFINFNCIDRENPGIRFAPVFLKYDATGGPLREYLNIVPPLSDLAYYRIFDNRPQALTWTDLLASKFGSVYERRGYGTFENDAELLARTANPFAFLIFSLLAMAIGWVYRSRYLARPPIISFFFIPIFPFILALIANLYLYMSTAVSGLALMLAGFWIALVVTLALQSFMLIVAFLIMAGKIAE